MCALQLDNIPLQQQKEFESVLFYTATGNNCFFLRRTFSSIDICKTFVGSSQFPQTTCLKQSHTLCQKQNNNNKKKQQLLYSENANSLKQSECKILIITQFNYYCYCYYYQQQQYFLPSSSYALSQTMFNTISFVHNSVRENSPCFFSLMCLLFTFFSICQVITFLLEML